MAKYVLADGDTAAAFLAGFNNNSDQAYAAITGASGGQTIVGGTLTTQNLTLRGNAADTTTGSVIVSSSKVASSKTVGAVQIAGGVAIAKELFAGASTLDSVAIGVASPTADLHIKAGSATASTAPLKFTSGPLLSSAEAGAVEFLTDKFYATNTSGPTRKEIALRDSYYGGFYAYGKAISFGITVANTYHPFYLVTASDIVTGLVSGFTFNAGRSVDANITSEASGTGSKLRIVCSAAHGLTTGDLVVIGNANNAGHNKPTRITTDGTNPTTEFLCDDITYVAGAGTSAATVRMPAFLQASTGSAGIYHVAFTLDGTAAAQNKTWKLEVNTNVTANDNIVCSRNTTNSLTSMTSSGNIAIADGDRIWLSGKTTEDTTNYTVTNMNLNIHRL